MYKKKTLKINNGFIINGTVNTGNIINQDNVKDIFNLKEEYGLDN